MVRSLLVIGWLALTSSFAAASYENNLNYRSPSLRHPELGLSKSKVLRRHVADSYYPAETLNFTHGVASGDPYEDSVILWTRVAPSALSDISNKTVTGYVELYDHDNDVFVKSSTHKICVDWVISTDRSFKGYSDKGTAHTSSDVDYTVKVEASHLRPFTNYYYQFTVCGSNNKSPVGMTKTIPSENSYENITLAVYSCSNLPFGHFNAFGSPVRKKSVDYVIHLGDYIYEYANGQYGWGNDYDPPRISQPDKILTTLYDYRTRIGQYRTDLDLYENHQMYAWIPVWDDHEVADNTWKSGSSFMSNTEASFEQYGRISFDQRKANAVRAYYEWMPLRQVAMDDNLRIWRNFKIGKMLDLTMLDTRHYDRGITDLYTNTEYVKEISNDQGRSLMGSHQEHWFYSQLSASQNRGAAWHVIGNQIVFSRLNQSVINGQENPLNYDAWDGYLANKNRTLNHLYSNKINNTIFLSGDSHANWVSDLVWLDEKKYNRDTGAGSIGVEFAGTGVSSPSPFGQNITITAANNISRVLVNANEELQWSEAYYRGYFELSLTREKATAKFYGFPSLKTRNTEEVLLATFEVNSNENKLARHPTVGGGVVANGYIRNGKQEPSEECEPESE